jgi:hypothetical protein
MAGFDINGVETCKSTQVIDSGFAFPFEVLKSSEMLNG